MIFSLEENDKKKKPGKNAFHKHAPILMHLEVKTRNNIPAGKIGTYLQ